MDYAPKKEPPLRGFFVGGCYSLMRYPKRPSDSCLGPAVKYNLEGSTFAVEGAKDRAHKPSISIGWLRDCNWPRNFPSGVYTFIRPSPKFPTRITGPLLSFFSFLLSSTVFSLPYLPSSLMSWLSRKDAGAAVTPHGKFRLPSEANLFTKDPSVLKTLTYPFPGPATPRPFAPN